LARRDPVEIRRRGRPGNGRLEPAVGAVGRARTASECHRRGGRVQGDRVVGARRGRVVVGSQVQDRARADARSDRAVAGRSADRDRVDRPGTADGRSLGPARGSADGHITVGEAGHRLTECSGERDRAAVGRIGLTDGLVDRHRRRRHICDDGDGVAGDADRGPAVDDRRDGVREGTGRGDGCVVTARGRGRT